MTDRIIVPISGGKDSQACAKLAVKEYGADAVEGLFCDTKFEHPVTYTHIDSISKMYGIHIHAICSGSVELQVRKHKRFPSGGARFCTDRLKILPSNRFYQDYALAYGDFEVWYGMRSGESSERQKRYAGKVGNDVYPPHEVLARYPQKLEKLGCMFRLPILEWSESDVFEYLEGEENPLYRSGFSRVGCFPCLAAGDKAKEAAFRFDEVGRRNFELVRSLEPITGVSIFRSKSGQRRNDCGQSDLFEGCSFCSI